MYVDFDRLDTSVWTVLKAVWWALRASSWLRSRWVSRGFVSPWSGPRGGVLPACAIALGSSKYVTQLPEAEARLRVCTLSDIDDDDDVEATVARYSLTYAYSAPTVSEPWALTFAEAAENHCRKGLCEIAWVALYRFPDIQRLALHTFDSATSPSSLHAAGPVLYMHLPT